MWLYFIIIYFCGIWAFSSSRKHLLITLLRLEFVVLVLYFSMASRYINTEYCRPMTYDLCVITEPYLNSGSVCTYTSWSIILLLTVHTLAVIISCDNAKGQLFRTQTTNSWTSLILNVKSKFRLNAAQRLYMMLLLPRHVCPDIALFRLSQFYFISTRYFQRSVILQYVDDFKLTDQWKSIRIAGLWEEIWKTNLPNTKDDCQSFNNSFRRLTFTDKPCKERRL